MFRQNVDLVIREKKRNLYSCYCNLHNMVTNLTDKIRTIETKNNTVEVMYIGEIYPSGTAGATSGNHSITKRSLNTVIYNTINGASLDVDTNVFILPVGIYEIHGYGEGFSILKHRVYLTSLDNDTMKYQGSSASSYTNNTTPSMLFAIVEVTEPSRFILNHYSETATVMGFGQPCDDGYNEVYAELFITKIK